MASLVRLLNTFGGRTVIWLLLRSLDQSKNYIRIDTQITWIVNLVVSSHHKCLFYLLLTLFMVNWIAIVYKSASMVSITSCDSYNCLILGTPLSCKLKASIRALKSPKYSHQLNQAFYELNDLYFPLSLTAYTTLFPHSSIPHFRSDRTHNLDSDLR